MKNKTLAKAAAFGLYVSTLTSCKRPSFLIRFIDEDGNVLQKENLTSGELPVYKNDIPTKENYYFKKWKPEITRVSKDQDYCACFESINNKNNLISKDDLNIYYKNVYFQGSHSIKNFIDDFRVDFRWFVNYPNNVFNIDIAKFAVIMNVLKGDFCDGIDSSSKVLFLKNRIGCDDIFEIDINGNNYEVDKNDTTGGFLAHKEITYFNQKYHLIIMSMKGTRNSSEWASNIDLGYDDASYYDKTGDHPEWIEKSYHKGFYVASYRWLKNIKEPMDGNNNFKPSAIDYVKKYSKNGNVILLITGHSRGGAIASILGEYFENKFEKENLGYTKPKVFTYTFASPNTCDIGKIISINSIFNIINKDDAVTMTPLNQWGFTRLGSDEINRSILSDLSIQYKDKIGLEYQYLKGISGILKNIKAKREEFYDVDVNKESNLARVLIFNKSEDAYNRLEDIKSLIVDTLKLPLNYFNFIIEPHNDKWRLKVYNCKATLLKFLGNLLSSKYSVINLFSVIKNLDVVMNDIYVKFMNDLLFETGLISGFSINLNAFIHPHDITSYILLIDNYKN